MKSRCNPGPVRQMRYQANHVMNDRIIPAGTDESHTRTRTGHIHTHTQASQWQLVLTEKTIRDHQEMVTTEIYYVPYRAC